MREEIFGLNRQKRAPFFTSPCRWWISALLVLVGLHGYTQNLKCRIVPTNQKVILDSLIIEPGSIHSTSEVQMEDGYNEIVVESTEADSVLVCYRLLSSLLLQPHFSRDITDYEEGSIKLTPTDKITFSKEELFDFDGVQKYGSLTRGVSFGNRQNLFVNSTLNLQMQGKLDENLTMSAVITDQNVPYQPEGNTQQIRDFDNVFIKLYNDKFDLTAGDIVLKQPENGGYFLKYYKNIQGIQVSAKGGQEWKYESSVSGATAKGKFHSDFVDPVDGLSGPYKMRGPSGERFIVILANSEKVFLDGVLMQRGFDRDYTIDYNLGEITFNNHIIITQFSIIRVDFEYAEQFYNRSNISAYQSLQNKNIRFFTSFYQEKDSPGSTLGFTLDEEDFDLLSTIGDNSAQAFITSTDTVQFNPGRILYEMVDTVDASGRMTTVFQYSTDQNATLFGPTFSEVGVGNGNYILSETTANGRIFEWISPIGNELQGSYQPGTFVALPNKRQLITLGGNVDLTQYEKIHFEGAFSNRDDNLFSDEGDSDNVGKAGFISFSTEGRSTPLAGYKWRSSINIEFDGRDYTYIDRYRDVLFDRDWNFDAENAANSRDLIITGMIGMEKNQFNKMYYQLNRRKRETFIDGWQQHLDLNQEMGRVRVTSKHFMSTNSQLNTRSLWVRSNSDINFRKWAIIPGIIFDIDKHEVGIGDSIVSTRMNYRSSEFYLTNADSSKMLFRVGWSNRQDRLPVEGDLKNYLTARTLNGNLTRKGDNSRVSLDLNYRTVDDHLELNEGESEVINGRINLSQSVLSKIVSHNFSYGTGNGRELRREFIFLPVATGEGTHTWRDHNEDGIQDLNEFFEALNPDERIYVKIFTPTDDYITSFQTFYLHTADIRMPYPWKGMGGFRSFASRFSANINININYKTTSMAYSDRLNPISITLKDDQIVSARDIKRVTFFFNRNRRGFSADVTTQRNQTKQLLTQGYEIGDRSEWLTNFKVDLSKEYTIRMSSTIGSQLNDSDFLESRRFDIQNATYKPQLIWQPDNHLRLIGSYEWSSSRNKLIETSDETSVKQSLSSEFTWSQQTRGSLRASFSYVNIDFTGDPATYLGYLLLDGLQPGKNQTWELNIQQRMSKGMQLTLRYYGRNSNTSNIIHAGNVQVTAFF